MARRSKAKGASSGRRSAYPGPPSFRVLPAESLGADPQLLRAALALGLTGWAAADGDDGGLVRRARKEFEAALRRALDRGGEGPAGLPA